ncbi:small subunit ribosomal protein S20 [Clostridium punense]|uniref:Small ribosomal subunit protein bS20 n=1 Tax=Clostridium punense TaxID=1054297 RepID=A0ABS4JXJ1_9CLOT|nr:MULTISPECIES: 30S ribosomal protein S20 [Clostridium]EQB88268.1 30S ribosomal protein S20 [Clostridium sp. BL8]MBP2020240.1 small subunit ribosomal protein S20 [Clostridium punense]
MANIKSAKKRIKVTQAKTMRNTMIKSALKTKIKKYEAAIASKDVELAKESFKVVVKALDMAASKGIIHKNKAARKKSRLATRLNSLSA